MKRLLIVLSALLLMVGCHNSPDATAQQDNNSKLKSAKSSQEVIAIYKEVDALTQAGKMDRSKMKEFVVEALTYVSENPNDTLCPHFLLYSGITQMQIAFSDTIADRREPQALEAIRILEQLRHSYPDYRNLAYAFYYKGQIYENLGKKEDAKQAYTDLVHRFPDSELGKNIAAYLQADGIDKSADEIWREF